MKTAKLSSFYMSNKILNTVNNNQNRITKITIKEVYKDFLCFVFTFKFLNRIKS